MEISNKYSIRRILAQSNVDEDTFYLVDWYPTWIEAEKVRRKEIRESNDNETPHTTQWGRRTVYKTKNPTSDDEGPLVRQLMESVLMVYQEYIDPNTDKTDRRVDLVAQELFRDDEWDFFSDTNNLAEYLTVASANRTNNITAAEIMRHTFLKAWNHRRGRAESSPDHRFGNVLVQYNGEIDEKATSHQLQPADGMTTVDFIAPIFAKELWDQQYMNVSNWDVNGTDPTQVHHHVDTLKTAVNNLIENCPYLLVHTWPLAFISLFYWGTELRDRITNFSDFDFELLGGNDDPDGWQLRAQNQIIYTYLDECEWENRCMDEVWQNFLAAQLFIHDQLEGDDGNSGENDDQEQPDLQIDKGKKKTYAPRKAPNNTQANDKGKAPTKQANNGEGPSGVSRKGKGKGQPQQSDFGEGPGKALQTRKPSGKKRQ